MQNVCERDTTTISIIFIIMQLNVQLIFLPLVERACAWPLSNSRWVGFVTEDNEIVDIMCEGSEHR